MRTNAIDIKLNTKQGRLIYSIKYNIKKPTINYVNINGIIIKSLEVVFRILTISILLLFLLLFLFNNVSLFVLCSFI